MRPIDADALKNYLSNRYMNEIFPDWWELPLDVREKIGLLGSTFKQAILNAPTIETEPVRHGRWKGWHGDKRCKDGEYRHFHYYACSECNCRTAIKSNYCPNCGAKMDGGAEE